MKLYLTSPEDRIDYPTPWYKVPPHFSIGLDLLCPFIWVGYFLITWIKFDFRKTVSISFMPD